MHPQNLEVARQSVSVSTRSRRRLDERVGLLFPFLPALVGRAIFALSPQSPLRRAAVGRMVRLGCEATNRGDFDAAFMLYHPDIEVTEPPQVVNLGLDPVSRGRAGRIHVQRRWQAEWGDFRIEPEQVADLGDRILVVSRMKGSGPNSGAGFDNYLANVLSVSAGRVIREEMFLDRSEALEAVGLRE